MRPLPSRNYRWPATLRFVSLLITLFFFGFGCKEPRIFYFTTNTVASYYCRSYVQFKPSPILLSSKSRVGLGSRSVPWDLGPQYAQRPVTHTLICTRKYTREYWPSTEYLLARYSYSRVPTRTRTRYSPFWPFWPILVLGTRE